jgi:ElaB protein
MESTKNVTHKTDSPNSINTASAPTRAREEASNIKDRAGEVMDQTRQAVTNAYEKTSETLSNTYDQAVTYGRENPGTFALIAFGAGIGIGVLLASGLGGRSRMSRIAEPIVGALSQVAIEFLR